MMSWYLRRYRPTRRHHVRFAAVPQLQTMEDRLTPAINFTAGTPFANNLTTTSTTDWSMAAGDFNADGKQDFVTLGGTGSTEVASFLGDGAGGFTFNSKVNLAGFAVPRPHSLVVGDFTDPTGTGPDGKDDFAYIDSSFGFVDVWASKGDGTFAFVDSTAISVAQHISLAAGELNSDGKTDLVVGRIGGGGPNGTAGEYDTFINNGDGTFTISGRVATNNLDNVAAQPTLVDVNGDGLLDMVANSKIAVAGIGRGGVYYGDGLGSFSFASPLTLPFNTGTDDHVVGDFDGDGLKDVALIVGNAFFVFYQTAPGVFPLTPSTAFNVTNAPSDVISVDYDYDGKWEIATAPTGTDTNIHFYNAKADKTFDSGDGTLLPTAGVNVSLIVIDGNAEGTPDLLVADRLTGPVSNKFQYFGNNNIPNPPISSSVTITASPNPVVFGNPITFTAKVAKFSAVPTGTIDFTVNGVVVNSGPLNASGIATFTAPGPFPVGALSYSASYSGDASFTPGQSTTNFVTIDPLASAVSVTFTTLVPPAPPTPGLSIYGANVPITAKVTPVGMFTPTGSFDFFANGFYLGTVPVDATGTAVLNTVEIPVNALNTITAFYSNDPIYGNNLATAADGIQVFQLNTVTDIITSSNPSVFGEPVTFTMQVSPDPAFASIVSPVFAGQIAILDNDNGIATVDVDATGKAVFNLPANFSLGTHTIQAVYAGTTNLAGSSSITFDQVVNKANSQIDLVPDNTTISFGDPVTLTATVSIVAPGAGTPNGFVTFFQDFAPLITLPVDAFGKAVYTVSSLDAGFYTFTASFSGNDSVAASASAAQFVTVDPTDSTTSLNIFPNPAGLGTSIALDAFVKTAAGVPVTTGTVTFTGDFNGVAFGPIVSPVVGGVAQTLLTGLLTGTGNVTAHFNGTSSINDSEAGPTAFTVDKGLPQINITSSTPSDIALGSTSKFSVTIVPPSGINVPITGSVDFLDNGVSFATVPLVNGAASTSVIFTLGSHSVTARYSGDANYNTVTSAGLGVSVFRPTDRFSVGAGLGGPDRVTVFDASGTKVFSPLFAFSPDYTAGVRVATADFNGDGVQDVAMGSGPGVGSRVRILDGATTAVLADFSPFGESFTGGVFVSAGDVNGDFKSELVVTPDQRGGARVRLFDNAVLNQIVFPNSIVSRADFIGIVDGNGNPDTAFRGGARAALGDINGDGFGDVVVAAGVGGGPRIAAFSGKTLTVNGGPKLGGDFLAFDPKLRNGSFVAVGDVNADGFADIITGAGPGGGPQVSIFSGSAYASGSIVRTASFFAGNINNRAGVPVAARYLDSDNNLDLLVGTASSGDTVTAYPGSKLANAFTTPTPLFQINAFANSVDPSDAFRGAFVG